MKTNSTPLRTALIYAFFSALWILLSDAASIFFIPPDSPNHILAQTIKGWLFVFASASLLYLILSREMKTLQKKQEQIRYQAGLVENVFDAIISTDMQFHIQSWNVAAERMYGWQASEVMGHLMAEFVQNEYISAPRESILKTAMEQGRWQGEVSQNHKDGSRFFVLTSLSMIQDENGQPAGFIAVNHDLTETKRVQEEAATLARFPAENPNPVMRVDLDGRLIYANKASAPLLELWDCGVNGYLPQEYVKQIEASTTSRRNLDDLPCDNRIFSMTIAPIDGKNYVNIYAMDITERKLVENILQESEARFSKIFHAGPIGINIFRLSDSRSFDVNDAFLHIIEYSREEVVNHSAAELNLFVDPQARMMWINALRELKGVRNQDVKIRQKSGEIRDTLASIDTIDINGEKMGMVIVMDITERKQMEESLRVSEEKFRLAFDTSPDAITITRLADGVYVSVNKGFEVMSGYTREQVIGKSSLEINMWKHSEDRNQMVEELQAYGKIQNFEATLLMLDAEIHSLVSASIIDFSGEPHLLAVTRDITERKKAEEKLHESEEKFKYIFDYSMIGKSITQPGGEVNVNQAFCEMLGYSAEELQNKTWWELSHPDDIEMTQKIIDSLLSSERESARFIKRYLHKNGATVWTDVSSSLRRDQEDKPLYFITSISDITERKRAEDLLRESEANLRSLIENTDGSIWAVDKQYGLIVGNREFHRNVSAVLGRRLEMGESVLLPNFPLQANAEWQGYYDRALQGEHFTNETQTRFQETPHYIEYRFSPIHEESGEIRGVTIFGRDITERKQVQEQLLKTLEELQRSNSELEQFAYVASHDLQEPLRAVAGMVQLLQKRYHGQLDERADEYINHAMDGSTRMQTLITDLLEYSRVDRRGNPIQLTDANEALTSALRNLQEAIQQGGATITNDTLPKVEADATQLTQLFQNLVGNAIKFRSERPPQIHIAVEDLPDAWHFSVHDNGIGIEPQYFERIFLVFQRLHTRREYSGTGIGLSICKKIVERHGGRIWVESKPEQGTTFHFTIPHRS